MKKKKARGRGAHVSLMSTPFAFTVETGIPVKVTRGFECQIKWPDLFSAMEGLKVGDSISYNTKELKTAVAGCRTSLEKRGTFRFVTTRIDATHSRTWRIDTQGNGKANRLNGINTAVRKKQKV